MLKNISIICLIFTFLSCNSLKQNDFIYWINSSKPECTGVGKMTCLQIQKNDTLNLNAEWNLFYSKIIGFEYEPGFIYKLKIKEVQLENVPANASSIKYTLIKVLEKIEDNRLNIHNIWVLESLNGKTIVMDTINTRPQIEINVTEMRISGTDGCNNITGFIRKLDDKTLEFGTLAQTKKMCINMEIPTLFSKTLIETKSYKKDKSKLILMNKSGKETIIFKKID